MVDEDVEARRKQQEDQRALKVRKRARHTPQAAADALRQGKKK